VSILLSFYLKMTKRRFRKPFKPLGSKKKSWHLVSLPRDARGFFEAAPFLLGLSKSGNVVLLMPKGLEWLRSLIKPKQFEIILYERRPVLFSEDYKRVRVQLGERYFHFLIELDKPANVSLPYLCNFQRRISFFDNKSFPYYNILMKNGYASLNEFFSIEDESARDMFHFYAKELKAVERKYRKLHPLLFVNGPDDIEWKGSKIVLGQDIMPDDPNIWKILYIIDTYYGKQDAYYAFARVNNKSILTQPKEAK
jgi:hypothetical protein